MDVLRRRTQTHDTADSAYGSATPSFVSPSRSNDRGAFHTIRDTLSSLARPGAAKTSRISAPAFSTPSDGLMRARADPRSNTQSTVAASIASQPTATPSIAGSSTTSNVGSLTPTMNGPQTPKPDVPDRTLSLGDPQVQHARTARSNIRMIQGMRIFNQEVEDTVIARFNAISDTLQPALIQNLRKGRHEFRPLGLQLLVLGHSEYDAKPWIVVLCAEPVKRRVTVFFQNDFARRVCRANGPSDVSFEVAVVGRPLRPTASVVPIQIWGEAQPLDTHVIWRPRIEVEHSGKSHYAKIGGFVCARDVRGTTTAYGLTVGHILPPDIMGSLASNYSLQNLDGSEDSCSCHSWDASSLDSEEDGLGRSEDTWIPENIKKTSDWQRLGGTVDAASCGVRARNRDWALIRIPGQTEGFHRGSKHDSGLCYKAATPAGVEDVLLYDGSFSTGKLSRLPARALLPYADDFVPVYVYNSIERGVSHTGASGSWVVDTRFMNKTDVYGMLVAQDPLENYWVVPMDDILQDLRNELTAVDVSLVTSREVLLAIQERQKRVSFDLTKPGEAAPQQKDWVPMPSVTRVSELRVPHGVKAWDTANGPLVMMTPDFEVSGISGTRGTGHQPEARRAESRKEIEKLPDWEKKVWYPRTTEKGRGKEKGKDKLTRMVREHAALQRELGIRRLSDLSQADTLINARTPSEGSSGQPSRPNTAHVSRGDAVFLSFDDLDDEDAEGMAEKHMGRGADSIQDAPAYTNIRTPQIIMAAQRKRREQREVQEQRDRRKLAAPMTAERQGTSAEPLLTPPPYDEVHISFADRLYSRFHDDLGMQ